jgi:tight adherence protein C
MTLEPQHVMMLSGAFSLILLFAGALVWYAEKRARMHRVRAVVASRSERARGGGRLSGSGQGWKKGAVTFMREAVQRLSLIKDRQSNEVRKLLVSAGYRSRDAVVVYTFFKLVAPLAFLGGAALYVYGLDPIGRGPMADAAAVMVAALFGSKLPDIILKNSRDKRVESIRKSLPDTLDMLVICAEAGLATDAALKRVVAETSRKSSVLGEELHQTALELSFMPERRQALENLAERAPVPSVIGFVNTLIQAEKYGTPLARAFKVLSQEQRAERMLRAEEKAGRLPATMTVPMMLFILPALFVVLIGPAILDIMDNFIGMER